MNRSVTRVASLWRRLLVLSFSSLSLASLPFHEVHGQEGEQWIRFDPGNGPGNGRQIVLISGDEEYRSEEALPLLGKILSVRHGFSTTVLFAIDPETGEIDPDNQTNIPGMEHLRTAELVVLFTRFRRLPLEQMRFFDEYLQSGRPIVGIRSATHAFNYPEDDDNPYAKYSYRSDVPGWEGGFGRQILGETWIDHHGDHGTEGTRALIDGISAGNGHPVLRGVHDIWVPTDVYGTTELEGDVDVLVWGQPTAGMTPDAPLNWRKSIMPVAWTKLYTSEAGNTGRVFTTTMGSAADLQSDDLRRLLVNACYWALGLEDAIPEAGNVEIVGEYDPTMFGFGGYRKGLTPAEYK